MSLVPIEDLGSPNPGGLADDDLRRLYDQLVTRERYRADKQWYGADLQRDDMQKSGWLVEDLVTPLAPFICRRWIGRWLLVEVCTGPSLATWKSAMLCSSRDG